jgi:hypothetical protein
MKRFQVSDSTRAAGSAESWSVRGDALVCALACALPCAALGASRLRDILSWASQADLVANQPAWLMATVAAAGGGLLGYWLRIRWLSEKGARPVLALLGIPTVAAMLVVVANLPAVVRDPWLLLWVWPFGVFFDVCRSFYHSVPLAALVSVVVLVDALVPEGEPGTVRQRMLRRRALVASIALSAVAARFDDFSLALAPAFFGMALVVLLLDVACSRVVAHSAFPVSRLSVLSDLAALGLAGLVTMR